MVQDGSAFQRKLSSTLGIIRRLEMQCLDDLGRGRNPSVKPHYLSLVILNDHHVEIPFLGEYYYVDENKNSIQLWDIVKKRYYSFKISDVVGCGLATEDYIPATKEEWERRMRETELKYLEEFEIRYARGKYR